MTLVEKLLPLGYRSEKCEFRGDEKVRFSSIGSRTVGKLHASQSTAKQVNKNNCKLAANLMNSNGDYSRESATLAGNSKHWSKFHASRKFMGKNKRKSYCEWAWFNVEIIYVSLVSSASFYECHEFAESSTENARCAAVIRRREIILEGNSMKKKFK